MSASGYKLLRQTLSVVTVFYGFLLAKKRATHQVDHRRHMHFCRMLIHTRKLSFASALLNSGEFRFLVMLCGDYAVLRKCRAVLASGAYLPSGQVFGLLYVCHSGA